MKMITDPNVIATHKHKVNKHFVISANTSIDYLLTSKKAFPSFLPGSSSLVATSYIGGSPNMSPISAVAPGNLQEI